MSGKMRVTTCFMLTVLRGVTAESRTDNNFQMKVAIFPRALTKNSTYDHVGLR